MKNRLLEICEKVLEINKTTEEYVAVFADGGWENYNLKDRYFFIFKDGYGNDELMILSYEDYLMLNDNKLLKENSYGGLKARSIFEFDIDAVINKVNKLLGEQQ